ncbi:hypothetical protein TNCV_4288221, partial [Trichonephila clavipes]
IEEQADDPPVVKNQESKTAAVPPLTPPLPRKGKRRENEALIGSDLPPPSSFLSKTVRKHLRSTTSPRIIRTRIEVKLLSKEATKKPGLTGIDPQIANYRLFKDDRIDSPYRNARRHGHLLWPFVPFPLKGALGSTDNPIEKDIADSLQEQFEPNHVADREVFDQRIHEEVANFLATPHVSRN